MIAVSQVRLDGGTQSRARIHEDTVAEYAEAMASPETVFPPIIVYFDGADYWLADGFHRLEAWKRIGRSEVPAEIRQGDRRKAILHSVAANSAHGLRRTNDDKRRAVLTLLEDAEWSQWSNREIARRCAVGDHLVADLRAGLTAFSRSENADHQRVYTTKHGTEAVMNTANIGAGSRGDQETAAPQQVDQVAQKAERPPKVPLDSEPDQESPERKAVARLTPEAMVDEILGLKAELAEERARRKAVEAERDNLKGMIKAFESEDMGRSLGNALREISTIKGRMGEYQSKAAKAERYARILEGERDALKKQLEAQVVPL